MKKNLETITTIVLAISLVFSVIGCVLVCLQTVRDRRAVREAEAELFADV